VYLIFADFAALKLNTADASTYLNIAENIVSHKGFVVSFDLYQFFSGHYHPLWPFMHPIYPLLCSLVFLVHGGIEQVIRLNIIILGLNAALIFYIAQRYISSRFNVLFLVFVIFSFNFFYSAIFPWTEQLHLLIFLICFILFLKFPNQPRALWWVGVLNAVLFLIRVSHIYSIAAYLFIICVSEEKIQQRLKNALIFIFGFLIVMGPYQLFNWVNYHTFYPEYLKPAADYTLARVSNLAYYHLGHIGIINPQGFKHSAIQITYFYEHMMGLSKCFLLFLIPAMTYLTFTRVKNEGRFFVLNCLCQAFFIVLGYSYSFCWNPSLETLRYSLIPFVLVSLAGWFCLYQLCFVPANLWKRLFGVLVLSGMILSALSQYFNVRQEFMNHSRSRDPYYINLYQCYQWIDQHLPRDILVASNEDQEGYFMHRPYISLPTRPSFSCKNLAVYNSIYAPDFYVLSAPVPDTCFARIAHNVIFSNKSFRILAIKKEKS